jgi:hypothetical protein
MRAKKLMQPESTNFGSHTKHKPHSRELKEFLSKIPTARVCRGG